jgi:hypothetical protein
MLAATVMACSTLDGAVTLAVVSSWPDELNPVMRLLLTLGAGPFFLGKLLLTAAGLTMLLSLRGRPLFRTRLRAGHVVLALTVVYGAVLFYEAILLWAPR